LETRLGFCLFQRDHQIVTLNDAGRAFIEEARLSVLHSERATQAARAALSNAEVVLRVGRSPYTDPYLISMLLAVRLALFPRLKIEISSGFSCDLVPEVLAGKLDLALATEPPASPMLSMTKVSEAPLYAVLSEVNELAGYQTLKLDQLNGKEWILFSRGVHPHSTIRSWGLRRIVECDRGIFITSWCPKRPFNSSPRRTA
jgi:DNA-binding transcriptional LysR family regulator